MSTFLDSGSCPSLGRFKCFPELFVLRVEPKGLVDTYLDVTGDDSWTSLPHSVSLVSDRDEKGSGRTLGGSGERW